jgi:ubiquinone/menaquinone biosynthesis C-methylase UbiE
MRSMTERELPNYFDTDVAERYDAASSDVSGADALRPTLMFLEDHARGGAVVEFAIGTGRVALPLAARVI